MARQDAVDQRSGIFGYIKNWFKNKPSRIIAFIILALIIVAVIAVIVVLVATKGSSTKTPRGVVVTNGFECAAIGASILNKGGNAVDAAIASLFCEGVAMPQSMGLGGGFLMTIYDKSMKSFVSLNAREVAPAAATENMFQNVSSTKGGMSVAVPGELRGYWWAFQKHGGKVEWKDIVQPTIDLCKEGIYVTEYLANMFANQQQLFENDPVLKETFIDPSTNRPYLQGQRVKRLRLAKTLEVIAKEGGDAIHNGSLTDQFVRDIRDNGGIITVDDLKQYKPEWQEPVTVKMPFNQTLYTAPLPGSGLVLGFIINILNNFLEYTNFDSVENYQKIVESFKYAYGKRTQLGDPNFLDISDLIHNMTSPEHAEEIRKNIKPDATSQNPSDYGAETTFVSDHGTAHISVLAPNGDAVSVTSTINLYFGSGIMSNSTGIILNDEMDDFSSPNLVSNFSIPPSEANYIRPGKRPLSSMSPSIIVDDEGDVRLVVGAAGGTKITTSVALIMMKNLWFGVDVGTAVADRRFHHQLFPMLIEFEETYNKSRNIIDGLHEIGHEFQLSPTSGFSAVTAIARTKEIKGATDTRRPGNFVYTF